MMKLYINGPDPEVNENIYKWTFAIYMFNEFFRYAHTH